MQAIDGQARAVARLLLGEPRQQVVLGAKAIEEQRVAGAQLAPPAPKLGVQAAPRGRLFRRVPLRQARQQVPQALAPLLALLCGRVQLQVGQRAPAARRILRLEKRRDAGVGRLAAAAALAVAADAPQAQLLPLILQRGGVGRRSGSA